MLGRTVTPGRCSWQHGHLRSLPRKGGLRRRKWVHDFWLYLLSRPGKGAGPRGQPTGCSQAELERVPWDELRGQVTRLAGWEGEQRAPHFQPWPPLPGPPLPFSDAQLCLWSGGFQSPPHVRITWGSAKPTPTPRALIRRLFKSEAGVRPMGWLESGCGIGVCARGRPGLGGFAILG